LYVILCVFNQK